MPTDGNTRPEMLTVKELAAELRVSTFTVYRHVQGGDLPAWRLGEHGQLRIPRTALDAFLVPAGREQK